MQRTTNAFIDAILNQDPAQTAICCPIAGETTYDGLIDAAQDISDRMGSLRGLVVLEPTLNVPSIAAYLGCLMKGYPVLLASEGQGGPDGTLSRTYRATVCIGSDGTVTRPTEYEPGPDPHTDLGVLLSTSGSTGGAKLVRLSRDNIHANAASIAEYLGLTASDRAALTLPLHYSYGLSILNSHLLVGATVCIPDQPLTSAAFLDWLDRSECTNLSGVPYSYEIFERLGLRDRVFNELRLMTAAGGRLPPDTVRLYDRYLRANGGEFFVMYGQTEATARISYLPPSAAEQHADCIGVPIPGGTLSLIGEDGEELAGTGQAGELVYRGPNVMMGYAQSPEDLARGAELDRLVTGDLAERTAEGYFRIVGRRSRFSKLSGFRVGHDVIEQLLRDQGYNVAVAGDDKHLAIAVQSPADLSAVTEAVIGSTKITPSQVKVLPYDELPRLPNGKADYARILAAADEADRAPEQDTAEDAGQDQVTRAFASAFWPQSIKQTDSFVGLGGDSLAYVGLTLSLERELGCLPERWEQMSVQELRAQNTGSRAWPMLDPNIYVRAAAIVMVIVHHLTGVGVRGGAFVLMALVGYSLAQFQSTQLFAGKLRDTARHVATNVGFYYLVLVSWMLINWQVRWPDLFLLANTLVSSKQQIAYNAYWFVEAYAQIVGFVLLVMAVPALRRLVARYPLVIGLGMVPACAGLVFLGRLVWYMPWHASYMGTCMPVTEVATWAAIGWCLYFAKNNAARLLVLALSATTLLLIDYRLYDFWNQKVVWYTVIFALIAWRVRIPLPGRVSMVITSVAAYAYALYLLHLMPSILLLKYFDFSLARLGWQGQVAELALGLGFPPLVVAAAHQLIRWLKAWRAVGEYPGRIAPFDPH